MSDLPETVGFVAPEPADLAPLFPGYDIHSLIATGGMGAVYLAVQKSLDRQVALKILPMEFSSDAAFCAGFEAEAKAMARLNHPNLIGVFDFGEVNGMLYIVMEYVAGKSLYHSAYGKTVDPSEVIRLVTGICNGLAHAHENGIIHRDIKPSNILLDLNAQPKIGDFGLARPIERKIEEGEEIFGTPHYTAPEVVNSPHSVDYRADIFSVGVLLHELLTAKLPADDLRPASIIARCDIRFDSIIRRATQPLAAARYSSAAQIAKELQAIAASYATKGPRPSGGATRGMGAAPRRPPSVRRATVAAPKKSSNSSFFALLLIVAAGGLAAFAFLSKRNPEISVVMPPPAASQLPAGTVGESDSQDPNDDSLDVLLSSRAREPAKTPDWQPEPAETTKMADDDSGSRIAPPKFDVPAFFERASKIMRDRAKSAVTSYRSNLKANFLECERSLLREGRRVKIQGERINSDVEEAIAEWREEGEKLPSHFTGHLGNIEEIDEIYRAYRLRQTGIRDTLDAALVQLADLYILGLEKQIERLEKEDDPGAIQLIQNEIERTMDDNMHFPINVLGLDDLGLDD